MLFARVNITKIALFYKLHRLHFSTKTNQVHRTIKLTVIVSNVYLIDISFASLG